MKLHVMNGWKDAPHNWRRYLFLPFCFWKTSGWYELSAFGFVFFWMRDR